MTSSDLPNAMRPPINRAMRVLDRSFFKKSIPLSAARVLNNKHLSQCRMELLKSKDTLALDMNIPLITADPAPDLARQGRKCILLRESLKANDSSTWGETILRLVEDQKAAIIPYSLKIDYQDWDYHQIISSILPPDIEEIPSGFSIVGHVAHLNLRPEFLSYKYIIAQVILDKNPCVRTVINKIDNVGDESEYRTFQYEVLAGVDDLDVIVWEEGCEFRFNYAKVYWNSRLQTEHRRLVSLFREGEAVCDVMAGIGPFAVPAGKKHVLVWANDLNPESHACLVDAIARNKVAPFVRAFNLDGHDFIRTAARDLWVAPPHVVNITTKTRPQQDRPSPSQPRPRKHQTITTTISQPRTFAHFIMNLPALALTFLPSYVGLYARIPDMAFDAPLPFIHAYCFSTKSDDNVREACLISEEVGRQLGFEMRPGPAGDLAALKEGEVWVHDVRDVAPNKRMFCASFRLPGEVAWRVVEENQVADVIRT